jgi:hypothetical protein
VEEGLLFSCGKLRHNKIRLLAHSHTAELVVELEFKPKWSSYIVYMMNHGGTNALNKETNVS